MQKGDLIKIMNNEYRALEIIGSRSFYNPCLEKRIVDQLYKFSKEQYPDLIEDLIITGGHSILVDEYKNEEERKKVIGLLNEDIKVDNKLKLLACIDENSSVFEEKGQQYVYHIVLENEDAQGKYGIYANGLLVESISKFHMMTFAKMNLL